MTQTRQPFPMSRGTGPRRFGMFLEPTCPFSVRAFGKIDALLDHAGADRITVILRLQSQPWHLFSGVVTRCIVAATLLPEPDAAWRAMAAVAAHREAFAFDGHCRGPNMDATPRQIVARLEDFSGLALAAAFARPEVEALLKWQVKYARQNGIHVSPTFMVDGLVQGDLGSGDPVARWAERLLG